MTAALFGLMWTEWGVSGVSGSISVTIRIAGVMVVLVIFFLGARLLRSAPRESSKRGAGSMFSSRAYWLVVALELVALGGGAGFLGATGHYGYIIAWFAAVVGLHLLAFGRLFWVGFYWLGTALIAAGIAGSIVGLTGGGVGGVEVTSGLIAGASLFVAGGWGVGRARASTHG